MKHEATIRPIGCLAGRPCQGGPVTRRCLHVVTLAAMGAVLALGGTVQAAALLEDGFATGSGDYTAGAVLVGQTGTPETGSYGGAWAGHGSGAQYGEAQVFGTGLSYTDGAGNTLQASGGGIRMQRSSTGGPYQKDAYVDPNGTPPSVDSVYFSGILDLGGAGNGWLGVRVGPTSSKDVIGVGVNSSGHAQIRQNGGVSATSAGTFDVSAPVFLVGRIQADGAGGSNDLVYLYLNPLLPSEPVAADLTHDVGTRGWYHGQSLEVLQLSAMVSSGAAPTFFDEFRIGSSWADVTAHTVQTTIPEPATMAALALAVTGLGGYVRKRHVPSGPKRA